MFLALIALFISLAASSGGWRWRRSSPCVHDVADHRRRLLAVRLRGHAGDGRRVPHHPRLLAVRHDRRVRQGQGERAARSAAPGCRRRHRQRVDEPGADALAQHLHLRPSLPVLSLLVVGSGIFGAIDAARLRHRAAGRHDHRGRTRRSSSPSPLLGMLKERAEVRRARQAAGDAPRGDELERWSSAVPGGIAATLTPPSPPVPAAGQPAAAPSRHRRRSTRRPADGSAHPSAAAAQEEAPLTRRSRVARPVSLAP